jgi:Holliday junction DNA helicase RuvA
VIARVEGTLREKTPTRVVVDVHGVGYELLVPLSTFTALPDEGKTVALRVHTAVREDAIQLFGFATALERAAFELLLKASRVGPRLAQNVLSGIAADVLLDAIRRGDVAALRGVPGVGTKTARARRPRPRSSRPARRCRRCSTWAMPARRRSGWWRPPPRKWDRRRPSSS